MTAYAILMFAMAASFTVLAVRIYRGNTDLIMSHHQNRVKDPAAYGRAFGKALAVIAAAMLLSGGAAMAGEAAAWLSMGILGAGMLIGITAIVIVQKKYNGGMF